MKFQKNILILLILLGFVACESKNTKENKETEVDQPTITSKIKIYEEIDLKTDLTTLSNGEKLMVSKLIDISKEMDEIFWTQSYGSKDNMLKQFKNEDTIKYIKYNYGPWDRLNGMETFVEKCGLRPMGARFYPSLINIEDFESIENDSKYSSFTLIRKDNDGSLIVVPYAQAYADNYKKIVSLLKEAASLSEDEQFKGYLLALADGLLNDDFKKTYQEWLKLRANKIDFIAGPLDPYEDKFLSTKLAHVGMVLLRDEQWSKRLERFSTALPELQKELPVDEKYKKDIPETNSDLGVYDVLYAAGRYNTGGKKIALNLPHSGCAECEVNSRKLQLRNVMQAKFEKILKPIGEVIMDDEQKSNINFDAFFENTMFYEVGNFLGPKKTINNKGKVSKALKEHYFVFEELKSDALSLFLITKLYQTNIFSDKAILDNYVTYMADIFRSIRFGVTNPQARANTMRFYYFMEAGAFTRNAETGRYKIDFDKMEVAVKELVKEVITIQGDGDYEKAKLMVEKYGTMKDELKKDVEKIKSEGIPTDVVFNQGKAVLGI